MNFDVDRALAIWGEHNAANGCFRNDCICVACKMAVALDVQGLGPPRTQAGGMDRKVGSEIVESEV